MPTLVMEFHGSNESVQEQARSVQEIAEELGGSNFQWATRPEDRSRIWKARHEAYFACLAMRPGSILYGTDAAVPISRLVDVILETRADVEEHGVLGPIRSEEHTSELQSLMRISYAVFCLKTKTHDNTYKHNKQRGSTSHETL